MKFHHTAYDNTTTQARAKNENKTYSEIKQNTHDARISEMLLEKECIRTQRKIAAAQTKQHEGEEDTGIRNRLKIWMLSTLDTAVPK